MSTAGTAINPGSTLILLAMSADGHIATVTLNRPDARNALSQQLVRELGNTLTALASRTDLRAVILTGADDRAFCAGADLRERESLTAAARTEHTRVIADVADQLAALPMPTIAAIHGYALAGGAELAIACDIRIAADNATLGFPEVRIGIFPGAGGVYRLPRLVSAGFARELLFTGRQVSAGEAMERGLVDYLVPPGEVLATANALARSIAGAAPLAARAVKAALARSAGLGDAAARPIVDEFRAPLDATADYAEGLRAFGERRSPRFTGH